MWAVVFNSQLHHWWPPKSPPCYFKVLCMCEVVISHIFPWMAICADIVLWIKIPLLSWNVHLKIFTYSLQSIITVPVFTQMGIINRNVYYSVALLYTSVCVSLFPPPVFLWTKGIWHCHSSVKIHYECFSWSPPPPSHYHGNSLLHNSSRKVSPVRLRGNHASLLFSFQHCLATSLYPPSLSLCLCTLVSIRV